MARKKLRTIADIPVPEKSIQAAIKTYLELDGWRVFETDAHRRHYETGSVHHPLGEPGMPDMLALRYLGTASLGNLVSARAEGYILWVEAKRRGGKAEQHQKFWHVVERERGALVVVLGEDCPASIDGWLSWYCGSGLMRRMLNG